MKKNNIIYIGNKLSSHGFTPTNIETLGPLLEKEGYNIIYASNKKHSISRIFDMFFTIIKNRRKTGLVIIDTYSTSAFYFALICSQCALYCKIPFVPILHGGNLPYRLKNSPKMTKMIFGNSSTNVVVSGYLAESMKQYGYKYKLIPNNIDIGVYPFKLRKKIEPKILWVRSFHKIYNPELAIFVMEKVIKVFPNAELAMVGPDKDGSLDNCKKLTKDLGISQNVVFTGRLKKEEWFELSKTYDIFINTTNFDNLPVSVLEALALGFPVISTNVGGIPFLLENNYNGILINPNDIEAMVTAMLLLLNDENIVEKLSLNARATAESFDWKIIRTKWIELVSSID